MVNKVKVFILVLDVAQQKFEIDAVGSLKQILPGLTQTDQPVSGNSMGSG